MMLRRTEHIDHYFFCSFALICVVLMFIIELEVLTFLKIYGNEDYYFYPSFTHFFFLHKICSFILQC